MTLTPFAARLRQHAANPRSPHALVMPGQAVAYPELLDRVEACADWLRREGCDASDTVGITIADEVTHLIASLALLYLGIPQVCLATHDPAPMRLRLAQRLAVTRVVCADPKHALDGSRTSVLAPEILRRRLSGADPGCIVNDPEATVLYSVSSGTTGEPKVIALTQRLLSTRAARFGPAQGFALDERVLLPVSVENYPGKTTRLYSVYLGVTSVLQPRGAMPWAVPGLCADLRVTCLELAVLQALNMVEDDPGQVRLPVSTRVFTGGSRVPAKLRGAFRAKTGAQLFVNYGAQEVWRMASTFPDGDDETSESVGKPVAWVDLQIVDGNGKNLPAGEVGEVRVRSDAMIDGYFQDPVATDRYFRDGWFHPGDLGSWTPRGALILHGRRDDMMNLSSIKIFPAEIEQVLEQHPAVKNAAAFAFRSTAYGDIPVAAVESNESPKARRDELMAYVRRQLGARAPSMIFIVDALPRNAAGKVVKRDLPGLVAARPKTE